MNDSYKVGHEQCPECAKRGGDTHHDNLAIFSDGHKYCFACGYAVKARPLAVHYTSRKFSFDESNENDSRKQYLYVPPTTLTEDFPSLERTWLRSYQITPSLISKYGIKYNEATSRIRFPLPKDGFIERRVEVNFSVGSTYNKRGCKSILSKSPKWKSYFPRKDRITSRLWGKPAEQKYVLLVEDMVSAIRCREVTLKNNIPGELLPLLGTNINGNDLYRLCREFKGVCVWLDRDKREKALRIASRASQWNPLTTVITSDKDPKSYSDEDLNNFIGKAVELLSRRVV